MRIRLRAARTQRSRLRIDRDENYSVLSSEQVYFRRRNARGTSCERIASLAAWPIGWRRGDDVPRILWAVEQVARLPSERHRGELTAAFADVFGGSCCVREPAGTGVASKMPFKPSLNRLEALFRSQWTDRTSTDGSCKCDCRQQRLRLRFRVTLYERNSLLGYGLCTTFGIAQTLLFVVSLEQCQKAAAPRVVDFRVDALVCWE